MDPTRHVTQEIEADQAQVAGRDFHHHEHYHYYGPIEQDIVQQLRLNTLREKERIETVYWWMGMGVLGLWLFHALVVWLMQETGLSYARAWGILLGVIIIVSVGLNWLADRLATAINRWLEKNN